MKLQLCLVAVLFATTGHLMASDPQQTLDSAHMPADLFQHANQPLLLEVDFKAQLTVPTEGRFLLKWKSKEQWWSKIVLGGFQQITIQNGEMRYTARNLGFTPLAAHSLFELVQFMNDPVVLTATKEKDRNEADLSLQCVKAQRGHSEHDQREYCLQAASHDLSSESWGDPIERWNRVFADYVDFGGSRYPQRLELFLNGSRIISATVLKLEAAAFDPELLAPPQGAIERRRCPRMKQPVLALHPDLGVVITGQGTQTDRLSLTVQKDGSVSDVQLISRGGQAIDEAALAYYKKLKFKPAMCGSDPVVADIDVEFRVTRY